MSYSVPLRRGNIIRAARTLSSEPLVNDNETAVIAARANGCGP